MQGSIDSKRVIRLPRRVRLLTAAAALAAAMTLAACGSSSPAGLSSPTADGASSTSPTLAFSKCVRTDGVPDFPDLTNGIRIEANGQTMSVNGVSVDPAAFQAARQKCQRYLPHIDATPAQAAVQRQRGLEFARCMRGHGVPNFPDPKVISAHGGNQEVYLPGINAQSPAFRAAARRCGGGPKGP